MVHYIVVVDHSEMHRFSCFLHSGPLKLNFSNITSLEIFLGGTDYFFEFWFPLFDNLQLLRLFFNKCIDVAIGRNYLEARPSLKELIINYKYEKIQIVWTKKNGKLSVKMVPFYEDWTSLDLEFVKIVRKMV